MGCCPGREGVVMNDDLLAWLWDMVNEKDGIGEPAFG